jgi:hypothetical protein
VKPALASENMFVQALTRGEKEKENHGTGFEDISFTTVYKKSRCWRLYFIISAYYLTRRSIIGFEERIKRQAGYLGLENTVSI